MRVFHIIIIIIIIVVVVVVILLFWEIFTSTLADGLSQEFEWQQVYLSLQDTSQYSSRSQQCCSLDGLHTPSSF